MLRRRRGASSARFARAPTTSASTSCRTADYARVAILDAGAYGFTMASRYNGRALASETFVRDGRIVSTSERAPLDAWADERARV